MLRNSHAAASVIHLILLFFGTIICIPSSSRHRILHRFDCINGDIARCALHRCPLTRRACSPLDETTTAKTATTATTATTIPLAQNTDEQADADSAQFTLTSASIRLDGEIERKLQLSGKEIKFSGPTSHQAVLSWKKPPKKILFLCKPHPDILPSVEQKLPFLVDKGLEIYVEDSLYDDLEKRGTYDYEVLGYMRPDTNEFEYGTSRDSQSNNGSDSDKDSSPKNESRRNINLRLLNKSDPRIDGIDMIIAFGGDGLLMHTNTLFSNCAIPPSMCFNFGSLGFLAPFNPEEFEKEVEQALSGPVLLTLRMKLECTVWKDGERAGTHHVLNEVVIDRGPSPFLSMIDVECDGQYLTTVQGDGIIVATPTGSTAYSLAAGGSMVHPSVPAILVTPICAHTLSFRPLLLPDSSTLMCYIPADCRASGWVSFDGKFRQELLKGDRLEIKLSPYPMPTVNRQTFTGDWFDSLRSGFMFNSRPRQKAP